MPQTYAPLLYDAIIEHALSHLGVGIVYDESGKMGGSSKIRALANHFIRSTMEEALTEIPWPFLLFFHKDEGKNFIHIAGCQNLLAIAPSNIQWYLEHNTVRCDKPYTFAIYTSGLLFKESLLNKSTGAKEGLVDGETAEERLAREQRNKGRCTSNQVYLAYAGLALAYQVALASFSDAQFSEGLALKLKRKKEELKKLYNVSQYCNIENVAYF